jgi:hypothetical protein
MLNFIVDNSTLTVLDVLFFHWESYTVINLLENQHHSLTNPLIKTAIKLAAFIILIKCLLS